MHDAKQCFECSSRLQNREPRQREHIIGETPKSAVPIHEITIRRRPIGECGDASVMRGGVWMGCSGSMDRSPHDLRHYPASVLIYQSASVKAVQRHLGHASATMTLDAYAHLRRDGDDITRAALEAGPAQIVSSSCPDLIDQCDA